MAFVFLNINNCICFALRNIIKTKNTNVVKYTILYNKDNEREQQWLITSPALAVVVIDFEYLYSTYLYYYNQPHNNIWFSYNFIVQIAYLPMYTHYVWRFIILF